MGHVQLPRCSVCGALNTPAEPLYRSLETGRVYCRRPRYFYQDDTSGRTCIDSDLGGLAPWLAQPGQPEQVQARSRGCLAGVLTLFLGRSR